MNCLNLVVQIVVVDVAGIVCANV